MCSITRRREKLLKVFRQIGLHPLGTISVKSLVSLNACVRMIYFPPTAKVIRRRSQFIVSSERLDYKSNSLTTRPRRLLCFNVSCSQVSGSGSLGLLFNSSFDSILSPSRRRILTQLRKTLHKYPSIGWTCLKYFKKEVRARRSFIYHPHCFLNGSRIFADICIICFHSGQRNKDCLFPSEKQELW